MRVQKFAALGVAMVALSLPACGNDQAGPTDVKARTASARALVKELAGGLKKQLKAALESGGPIEAIGVCKTVGPALAQSRSETGPMTIRRTALKLRNPDNAPDEFERRVMEMFEAKLKAGEPASGMEYWEIVTSGEAKQFRYMKAIPTAQKPCLACHGSNLKPEVQARILELYPKDQATGFSVGELRGAFSVSQPVE